MKNRACRVLKVVIADLRSMAKSKTMALKSKTNAIRARLIILSLVMNKKFVVSSISHKFQSVLRHHSNPNEECLLEDRSNKNKAMMVFNEINNNNTIVSNPSETQRVVEDNDQDGYESYYKYEEDYDYGDGKCMYLDLTHTLFESENLDLEGSVNELVKSSKEEEGQELKMEEDIDYMADLFIKKFHRQIMLQKQDSLKRCHGMC
ncbi:hypothetical protein Lal_00027903 [Lupinus albus]|uniref:Uncharacterized protein n=1 Tax=Lupinus albus TaxID=3870 RepID=A0A6A5LN72_LUPAL|nr:hypothetical protein Lalb_Chr21g0317001 [Lupinus albus]KAF1860052.1 hypothetical protein Lal_00027903 [Lupinus albus]